MENPIQKKIAVSQSNYIPWKGYFDSINLVDQFVLYDDMQYTKRDWRNRNKIKTAGGLQWLTIPVEVKGKFYQKINETKVSDKKWNIEHWSILRNNYSKAFFFKDYKDFFEELYLKCNEDNLSEINYKFIKAICTLLNIKTKITLSSEYELRGDRSEKLLNVCLDAGADEYYSGPAAKDYLDIEIFQSKGIKVNWFDNSNYKEYEQLYPPFEHGVSIIDLIFNTGPNAKNYLKSFANVPA